jgi:hypothetical protein
MNSYRRVSILMNMKEEYFQSLIAWFTFYTGFFTASSVFVFHVSVLRTVRCFATSVVSSLLSLQSKHRTRLLPIIRLDGLSKTTYLSNHSRIQAITSKYNTTALPHHQPFRDHSTWPRFFSFSNCYSLLGRMPTSTLCYSVISFASDSC